MGVFNFMESFFFISLGITFLLIIMLVYHFKQRIMALEHKHDTMFEIVNNVVKQLRNMQTTIQHLGDPQPFMISHPTYTPAQPVFESIQIAGVESTENDDDTSESESDEDSDDETSASESDEEEPVETIVVDELPKENIIVEPVVQEDEILIRKSDGSVSALDESSSALADSKDKYKKMTLAALKTVALEKGLVTDASKMKKPELLKLLEAHNE
jgi:hypothetical protein